MSAPDPAVVRAKAETLLPPIREVARALGYAIAVHGSLARDIDLVAIPWTEEAHDGETLAQAVAGAAAATGDGWAGVGGAFAPKPKPHGRTAWTIHLEGGTYIDLSVTPRLETPR